MCANNMEGAGSKGLRSPGEFLLASHVFNIWIKLELQNPHLLLALLRVVTGRKERGSQNLGCRVSDHI